MKLIDLKNRVDHAISLRGKNKDLKVEIAYIPEKGKYGGTPSISIESCGQGIDWNNSKFFLHTNVDINEKSEQFFINGVSKSFTASEVADKLAKEFSTIEEAISYFEKIQQQYMFTNEQV